MFIFPFGPFFQLGRPGELDHECPEAGCDERIHCVVKEPNGHKAEDEVRFIPIPEVLVENSEEDKDSEDEPRFLHESSITTFDSREAFHRVDGLFKNSESTGCFLRPKKLEWHL